jgi:hypothetical protein
MTSTATLDDEQRSDLESAEIYRSLLERLSEQSVVKHFDAYVDVPWDDPAFAIDRADPRFELSDDDPLAASDWYRNQPQEVRAALGLHRIVANMKTGLQFESVLKRGLLEYATTLSDGDPQFRYTYHEVIEEAQHSLMFQEFVNRSGLRVSGMPKLLQWGSRRVVPLGRRFPALFFLFVLGGEDPIDFVQRSVLRSGREIHPLLERIMRIHVTEEARHLSFARHYLKRNVPTLGWVRRQLLSIQAPMILGAMAAQMLQPSPEIMRTYGVPRDVRRAAYHRNPVARQYVIASLAKVRNLCVELRLVTPVSKVLWRAFGIWPDSA